MKPEKTMQDLVYFSGALSLPYRLHVPKKTAKKPYPLILFLHGMGERGEDNLLQLKHGVTSILDYLKRHKQDAMLVAPQCPLDDTWTDLSKRAINPSERSLKLALELVEILQEEYPLDSNRLYITGLSMGGFATWSVLCEYPERFAAAIPICGGGNTRQAKRLINTPIWAFHGDRDEVVRPEYSRKMVAAIQKHGGQKIHYREYEGVEHDSWSVTYADDEVLDWLFAQKH